MACPGVTELPDDREYLRTLFLEDEAVGIDETAFSAWYDRILTISSSPPLRSFFGHNNWGKDDGVSTGDNGS